MKIKELPAVNIKKTWAHVHFTLADADIEVMMNYETKSYTLMTEDEDGLISIKSDDDENIKVSVNKARCIIEALVYIRQELHLPNKVQKAQASVATGDDSSK